MIIAVLSPAAAVFLQPKPAQAQFTDFVNAALHTIGNLFAGGTTVSTTTTAALGLKDVLATIAKQILMTIARKALQEMTKSTVAWINSGFHGSPLFVQNPQSFFLDITQSEIKNLIGTIGYDAVRFPFGKQFALNTISAYKSKLNTNAAYSLSTAISDPVLLRNYQNNFSTGGWNGFLLNTQYPQNNPIGFNMLATNQLATQLQGTVQNAAQTVTTTLQQGQGFLSPQTCPSNPNYPAATNPFNPPTWNSSTWENSNPIPKIDPSQPQFRNADGSINYAALQTATDAGGAVYTAKEDTAKAAFNTKYSCPKGLVNTTPGAVVASQITRALGESFSTSEIGIAVGNSLSAVFDALLNKLLGSGLNALASTINPPAAANNFSYDGQTLGSPSTNVNGNTDVFSGPDQEVILDAFKKQLNGQTNWTAKAGEKIITLGDTRTGTCTGLTDARGNSLSDEIDISKLQCDTAKGSWTDTDGETYNSTTDQTTSVAVAGQAVSELGDTSKTSAGTLIAGRTYAPGDIANTQAELILMDNDPNDPNNPNAQQGLGITQELEAIWPATEDLDICTPGPDLGWEQRLTDETNRNSTKLEEKSSDQNGQEAYQAQTVLKELKFAVNSFQDWISTAMIKIVGQNITALPHSANFIDAVNQITNTEQTFSELTNSERTKKQTLARLQAIAQSLKSFTDQPAPGSQEEKDLVALQNQYDSIADSISNSVTISNTQAQLDSLKDQLTGKNGLNDLVAQCTLERGKAGWSVPTSGTWRNTLAQGSRFQSTLTGNATIASGNAAIAARFPLSQQNNILYPLLGGELEQFCGEPIAYGYSHGSFIDQIQTDWNVVPYPDIPLVNGRKVYSYKGGGVLGTGLLAGTDHVDISISCDTIFRASPLDYKGSLPSSPYSLPPVTQIRSADCGAYITNSDGTCGTTQTTGTTDPIGTCTTTTNGTSTTTQTTQSACVSPGVWTAPATNNGTTNSGTTNTGTSACGSAGQPACG